MKPEAAALLWDAREAAQRVQRFIANKTFEDYLAEELLRSGVERQLTVVGEALGQLRKTDAQTAGRIRALPKAVGLRNILVHAYANVDHRIVWGVVQKEMSTLSADLDRLLKDASK